MNHFGENLLADPNVRHAQYDEAFFLLRSVLDEDDESLEQLNARTGTMSTGGSIHSDLDEPWLADTAPQVEHDQELLYPCFSGEIPMRMDVPEEEHSEPELVKHEAQLIPGMEPDFSQGELFESPERTETLRKAESMPKMASLKLSDSPSKTLRKSVCERRRKLWDFLEKDFTELPAERRIRFIGKDAIMQHLSAIQPLLRDQPAHNSNALGHGAWQLL